MSTSNSWADMSTMDSAVVKRSDLRFSLGDIAQARTMLTHKEGQGDQDPHVPACFTREGWEGAVSQDLGNIDALVGRDAWVLPKRVLENRSNLKTELLNNIANKAAVTAIQLGVSESEAIEFFKKHYREYISKDRRQK